MKRQMDARGLIVLPKLDAGGATTLVDALLTRVKEEEELPKTVADAARRLKQSMTAISEVMRTRFELASEALRIEAHRVAASRWKALYDVLKAWSELKEGGAKAEVAKQMLSSLFADGLLFTRPPFITAFNESEQRLKWFAKQELAAEFAELGGAEFLAELRAAHKKYGEALGVKKSRKVREQPSLREPYEDLTRDLRRYLVQVIAYGDLELEGASEQATRLLAPFEELVRARSKPTAAPSTESPTTAPPAAAPATNPAVAPATQPPTT